MQVIEHVGTGQSTVSENALTIEIGTLLRMTGVVRETTITP